MELLEIRSKLSQELRARVIRQGWSVTIRILFRRGYDSEEHPDPYQLVYRLARAYAKARSQDE